MIDFLVSGQSLIHAPLPAIDDRGAASLQSLLQGCDVAFTNLEGTVSPAFGGWPSKDKTLHLASREALESLRALGFNALALSNNHAFDLGPEGILATRDAAAACGFLHAGIGRDLEEATGPAIGTLNGRRVALVAMDAGPQPPMVYAKNADRAAGPRPGVNRLGLVSSVVVTPEDFARAKAIVADCGHDARVAARIAAGYQAPPPEGLLDFFGIYLEEGDARREERRPVTADLKRNLAAIARGRAEADLVIAYLHQHQWAPDWRQAPAWIKPVARRCIEAGADVFVSHGAPTLHGLELYRGKPIFWGLGCFVFDTGKPERYGGTHFWESLVARCRYDEAANCCTVTLFPIEVGRTQDRRAPRLLKGAQADQVIERILADSSPAGLKAVASDGGFALQRA